ncbi:GGDEF domain-containing protein [Glaciecola sp. SC05]|uniref:GGDEF domain-containing protein n=1 Tax=Glaciecola sp. SC05 TaxID=1987355 RepID=UPI003527FC24
MIFWNTYRRAYVLLMQFYLCTLVSVGSSLTVIFGGVEQVYWIYPSTLTLFFLVSPLIAFAFTIGICLLIFPTIMFNVETMQMVTIFLALFGTAFFINVFASEIRTENANLSSLAAKDFLTGCGNRRAFKAEIEKRYHDFLSDNKPSSLIVLDIDDFKVLNDKYGHLVGDKVLKVLVDSISHRIRRTDNLYRLGGEEFAILVPNAELSDSLKLAEEIKSALAKQAAPDVPKFTVSLGVTQVKSHESIDDWIARADMAMYKSKNTGKNRVTHYA